MSKAYAAAATMLIILVFIVSYTIFGSNTTNTGNVTMLRNVGWTCVLYTKTTTPQPPACIEWKAKI